MMKPCREDQPSGEVLVVAYYFPPMGLSGVQRVAKLVKYLPCYDWKPTVLTVEPGGYFAYDPALLEEITGPDVRIHRTRSWDPTRLFGSQQTVALPDERRRQWLSRLSQAVFIPDNKIGWYRPALQAGRRLIQSGRFDAIFSSAPPYTAHLIAASLSRWSGLPLITDFRDDWVGNPRHTYPTPLHRRLHERLERRVIAQSRRVFTINEHIRGALIGRNTAGSKPPPVAVLPQGYDPEDFRSAAPKAQGRMRLLYSGIFYDAQTPDYFLRALAGLIKTYPEMRQELEAVFVGLVPEASRRLAGSLGLDGVVRYEGYVSHRKAVAYLQSADVLWMTVGERRGAAGISTSKLFEYFGARKPILALVPEGAVREALEGYGAARVVAPGDEAGIGRAVRELYRQWKKGRLPAPEESYVRRFDRKYLAGELAHALSCCRMAAPR